MIFDAALLRSMHNDLDLDIHHVYVFCVRQCLVDIVHLLNLIGLPVLTVCPILVSLIWPWVFLFGGRWSVVLVGREGRCLHVSKRLLARDAETQGVGWLARSGL